MESSRLVEQISHTLKKIPQALVAKILTVILVIYSAYLVAFTAWQFFSQPVSHGVIRPMAVDSGQSTTSASRVDVSSLIALNVFGKEQVKTTKSEPKQQTTVAPKTRLNLTLTGIVADNSSNTSDTSVAIIESRNSQSTYGIGDTIESTSAKVDQILLDRVILSVGAGYETLMLEGIEYSTTIPGSADELKDNINVDAIRVAHPPGEERTPDMNKRRFRSQAGPGQTALQRDAKPKRLDKSEDTELSEELREQREQLFEDPKQLLDYINITPQRQGGELLGYRLRPGKDPSLFQRAGLLHNDLAVEINGYDLTDMRQALTLMRELREITEANITVLRDGSPVQIILAL